MNPALRPCHLLPLIAALALAACSRGYGGEVQRASSGTGSAPAGSMEEHFASKVQPRLDFCRSCHVPGGVGDVEDGHDFMLDEDSAQDLDNFRGSWELLGSNNPVSRILLMASGQETPHTGGAPWPAEEEAYRDVDLLLQCFEDPDGCQERLAASGSSR